MNPNPYGGAPSPYAPPGYGGGYGAPDGGSDPLSALPPTLDQVNHLSRMTETRGWGFGAVSIAALLLGLGYLVDFAMSDFDNVDSAKWGGIAMLVGLASLAIEIFRQVRRTTLVPSRAGLGIYRRGQLSEVVQMGQVMEFRLNIFNTIREFFAFGMMGLMGACGTAAFAGSADLAVVVPFAWAAAAAISCLGGLSSSIWTRALSKQYYVPRGGGTELVILPKGMLRNFGWIR